jgi:hypothetical protein
MNEASTIAGHRLRGLLLGLLAVALTLALTPAAAGARPAGPQQSASGEFTAPFFWGSFEAVSDAGGANARGQLSFHEGGGFGSNTTATVICLEVSGNRAVIGFRGTWDTPFPEPPVTAVGEFVVTDNGPANSSLDTIARSVRLTDTGEPSCTAPGPLTEPVQVFGDMVVRAAVVPTSRDQCRHGGYAQFGFKNRGQCVAFVRRSRRQDSVTGESTLYTSAIDPFSFAGFATLDARSGPRGGRPVGTFTAHIGGGQGPDYRGTVTCLSVTGNRAVIGVEGTWDPPFGPPPLPFAGIVVVTDGGPASTEPPFLDTFALEQFEPPGPTDCSTPRPAPTQTFAASDITVVDAAR